MAHYLVMGAGKMGVVLAKDLIESDPEGKVTLVDIDFERLRRASEFIQSERLLPQQRDIEDESQRHGVMQGKDVALCALLHGQSLMALDSAVDNSVHYVDLVGEGPLERKEYDRSAKEKGVAVISGLGVSPGITNVCVGRGVRLLDEVEHAKIYVGGVPVAPKPPLNYRIVSVSARGHDSRGRNNSTSASFVWSGEHTVSCTFYRDGMLLHRWPEFDGLYNAGKDQGRAGTEDHPTQGARRWSQNAQSLWASLEGACGYR